MTVLTSFWISVLALANVAMSQNKNVSVSSYCTSDNTVCASVNIPTNSSSTFFRIQSSKSNGWTGVGIGQGMAGSLIFVVYENKNGDGVIVSPRIGTGHIMPEYESQINIQMINSSVGNNSLIATFICSNCREWNGGSLSTSGKQSFIYAVGGSGLALQSNDVEETIQKHERNGNFKLDMTQATGGNGSSSPFSDSPTTGSGGSDSSAPTSKADQVLIAHGIIMAFTWVLLFPLGASVIRILSDRLPNPLLIHRSLQSLNFILVIVGMALGIWTSGLNKTHFRDFHQYFGIILVLLVPVQAALGILHHRQFQKTGKRSPFSYAHIWFGRTLILLGIFNGGLGLSPRLADASGGQIAAYLVVAVLVIVSYATAYYFMVHRRAYGAPQIRV